ncbi:MAG: hypothetical protein ACKVP0_12220 [Pirellulaceae bacterium]
MRCPFLAFILFVVVPSLANGEEPAPSEPARKTTPFVQEVTGSGPSERLLHLKAALAHLERAGFEEPEIAKAAAIVGDLLDAEKSDEAVVGAFQAVDVHIKVFEVNMVKLRAAVVKNLSDDGVKLAAQLEELAGEGLARVISEPRIQTLSGREANYEVGNDAEGVKMQVLPTVLKGNKIRIQLECNLFRTPPPPAANGPDGKPLTITRGVKTKLEVAPGKSVILSRSHDVTRKGAKVEDTELIFMMTPNLAIAREAKGPATSRR